MTTEITHCPICDQVRCEECPLQQYPEHIEHRDADPRYFSHRFQGQDLPVSARPNQDSQHEDAYDASSTTSLYSLTVESIPPQVEERDLVEERNLIEERDLPVSARPNHDSQHEDASDASSKASLPSLTVESTPHQVEERNLAEKRDSPVSARPDQDSQHDASDARSTASLPSLTVESILPQVAERDLLEERDVPVSARPNQDSQHEDVSDASSIASLPSLTVGSTAASDINTTAQNIVEEFVALLFKDDDWKHLFESAFQILESRRFSRNFTRLLRQYSQDLMSDARTSPQREAALFVKQKARYISSLIVESYDPINSRLLLPLDNEEQEREKQLTRYLAGEWPAPNVKHGFRDRDESDDDMSDIEDAENIAHIILVD
jgi:hypothetical protein